MSTEGRIAEDNQSVIFSRMEFEGIEIEVQHPLKSGLPFSPEPGWVGFAVVTLPTGQPRIVLHIKHSDGSSLAATFDKARLFALLECVASVVEQADVISASSDAAKDKAS